MNEAIGIEGSAGAAVTTSSESSPDTVISRLEAKLSAAPEPKETETAEKATSTEDTGAEDTRISEESEEKDSPEAKSEESEDQEESEEEESEETEESEQEEDAEESDEDAEESDEDAVTLTEEQLAETLGFQNGDVQVDEEGNILFRTKVDGAEAYVSAKDLVASYQLEKHNQNKSKQLSESIREFEVRKNEEETKIGNAVTEATGLVQYFEQKLLSDYSPQKLEALRNTNPAEWAAKRQELQEKQHELVAAKKYLANVIQQKQQEQQQAEVNRFNRYVEEQTDLIKKRIPEWSKPEVFIKENEALQTFVTSTYGFTPEEYAATNDHRMFLLMRDAAKGRALSNVNVVKNKLKTLPKIVKSGTPQPSKKVRQKKAIEQKRARVKQTGGDTASIASLLMEKINV